MALKEMNVAVGSLLLVEFPEEDKRISIHVSPRGVAVQNDKCKHRGGPLHLCYRDGQDRLRCPWHDRRIAEAGACDEISAAYYASRQLLRMVNPNSTQKPWPVRLIST